MKRLLTIILSCALLTSLFSCGNSGKEQTTSKNGETKAEDTVKEEIKVPTPLSNTYYRLTHDKELNVAYLGGSITQGGNASEYSKNWVALTTAWLSEQFPDAAVNENNSGISNTGSNYGIFRLEHDIFDVAVPDLIFIEFTSNDWGRFGDLNISRQNESIIRKLYEVNPKVDIVFLYTNFGSDSPCRRASTALAQHYGLLVVDPGSELKRRIDEEEGGVYDKYSNDKIHPNDVGHAFYLEKITEQFSKYLVDDAPEKAEYLDFVLPEPLNESGLFMNPEIIEPITLDVPEGFELSKRNLKMKNRTYEYGVRTKQEGAEYSFSFEGTGFGLLVNKTSSVSDIQYSVDGGEFKNYSIGDMHNYDHGQMYILEYDLEEGNHDVVIRNVASKYGTDLIIMGICINN